MGDQIEGVSQNFEVAAVPKAEQVLVPLDKDIAEWLSKQGDIVREVNGLCRFYMDSCIAREFEFDVEAFEAAQTTGGPNTRSR